MEHGGENDSGLNEVNVQASDGRSYEVPWTVYTALALPSGKRDKINFASCQNLKKNQKMPPPNFCIFLQVEEPPANDIPENIDKLRRRSFKNMRAQSSYHIEYQLPGDENAVNLDLIVYGPLAKLYRGDDFKVRPPQQSL